MNARPFEWTDLEIFLAWARAGSLASAASVLRLDPSTVHRRLEKLEASLGTRLLHRNPRGSTLTDAGRELSEHACAIEGHVLTARRRLAAQSASLTGNVTLATVDDLAISVLMPMVARFRQRHPGLSIIVDVERAYRDLARQQAELALRLGPRPNDDDVVARLVCPVEVAFYASEAYVRRHGLPTRLEDVGAHVIVRGDEGMAAISSERFVDRHFDPARIGLRSSSFFVRLAAIREGVGVGVLGRFMGDAEPTLIRAPIQLEAAGTHLWLVSHVDLKRHPGVAALTDHLMTELTALKSRFAPSS